MQDDEKTAVAGVAAVTQVTVELRAPGQTPLRFQARSDRALLQSAQDAGVSLPSSCRNGTCRACISQLHSGQISYRMQWPGLLAEEKATGLFLPCAAYPLTDLVMSVGEAS